MKPEASYLALYTFQAVLRNYRALRLTVGPRYIAFSPSPKISVSIRSRQGRKALATKAIQEEDTT
jgi:hypothetical protein